MTTQSGQATGIEGVGESNTWDHRPRAPVSRLLKHFARKVAVLLVIWRLVVYRITSLFVDKDSAFAAASESIARIPGLRGVYLRQAFYRHTLADCSEDVYFGWQTVFSKTGAKVGYGAYLGRRCSLGLVDLGANTMLSDGVQILSGGHQHGTGVDEDVPFKEQAQSFSRVCIGANSWIGTNAVIMADIGRSSIIGAGAVVTESVPDFSLAAGIPAKVKKSLRRDSSEGGSGWIQS